MFTKFLNVFMFVITPRLPGRADELKETKMFYQPYVENKKPLNVNRIKNVAIVILALIVVLLLGVILQLKRANNLREYALANNCEWVYQGTMYGDDRDFICK